MVFTIRYENRPIEIMVEAKICDFLLHPISLGKAAGSVNIYNSALRFIFGAVLQRNLNFLETVYGAGLPHVYFFTFDVLLPIIV